jgi:hypothetical protein
MLFKTKGSYLEGQIDIKLDENEKEVEINKNEKEESPESRVQNDYAENLSAGENDKMLPQVDGIHFNFYLLI